jgi:hypothetical protein
VFPLSALFAWGFLKAIHEQYVEIEVKLSETKRDLRDLREQLVPKLQLVFDPRDEQCSFTSSVEDAVVEGSAFRILRVRVKNGSASRLDRVRVLVEELGQAMPWGTQPLRFQHDLQPELPDPGALRIPPQYRYPRSIHGFDFAPHEQKCVQLLRKKATGQGSDQFEMYFAEIIPPQIPAIPTRIVVVAYADNSLPTTHSLRVLLDDDGLPYAESETSSA